MRSRATALDFKFKLVLDSFDILHSPYSGGINDFAKDQAFRPEFRAAIIYLTIRGRYPKSTHIEALTSWLSASRFDDAISYVQKKTSLRDLRRLLVPGEGTLIDVTRYSRTAEMSGIPRVVKNFITSKSTGGSSLGVWSDQVFAPVQMSKSGHIFFDRSVWGNSRNLHYFYFLIRKLFFSKSPKMVKMRFLSLFLKALRRMLFGRLLLKMVDLQAPRACYIINPSKFVIPEVPDAINSELLRVWISSTGLKQVRSIVHDLLPLTHPEYFPKHAFGEHKEYVKLLEVCETLVVGTPVLARELSERLELSNSDERIKVLPLPVSLNSASTDLSKERLPLFTFIGGYQSRKGLKKLVDFLDIFDGSQINFRIAVVGVPNVMSGHEEGRLYARLLKRPDIYEIRESLDDSTLADLMRSSSAVLYISSAEGYGLPVLESLSLGTPVIAARTPVNEHFSAEYGGIHFLSDSYSETDLLDLNEIATGGPLRESLKASIRLDRLPLDTDKWAKNLLSL